MGAPSARLGLRSTQLIPLKAIAYKLLCSCWPGSLRLHIAESSYPLATSSCFLLAGMQIGFNYVMLLLGDWVFLGPFGEACLLGIRLTNQNKSFKAA